MLPGWPDSRPAQIGDALLGILPVVSPCGTAKPISAVRRRLGRGLVRFRAALQLALFLDRVYPRHQLDLLAAWLADDSGAALRHRRSTRFHARRGLAPLHDHAGTRYHSITALVAGRDPGSRRMVGGRVDRP